MHAPPQTASPTGQLVTHVPDTHAWPLAQVVPHPPQFNGSIDELMQAPLQAVRPVGH
jgi:hypothetical protein